MIENNLWFFFVFLLPMDKKAFAKYDHFLSSYHMNSDPKTIGGLKSIYLDQFRFKANCIIRYSLPQASCLNSIFMTSIIYSTKTTQITLLNSIGQFIIIHSMDYTHYWQMLGAAEKSDVKKVLQQVAVIVQTCGPALQFDFDQKNPPLVSEQMIHFNGIGEDGSEAFIVNFEDGCMFGSCKTNKKPYDTAVCLVLLTMRKYLNGFDLSSDGSEDEWRDIIDLHEEIFGKITNFEPKTIYKVQ